MGDTGDAYDGWRESQQKRRSERLPRYIKYAAETGHPWRWMNEPFQMRFEIGEHIIDFYTTHAVVHSKLRGQRKWRKSRGFKALKKRLQEAHDATTG